MPFVETTVGRIFYAGRGAGGPAVLCLHGAGGSHRHWSRLLAGLGDRARLAAPDLPGHGRSAPPGRASVAAYADVAVALLDALGLERAIVVGHSMGAATALELACARPDRVAGLILAGASARLRVLPALIAGLAEAPAPTIDALVGMLYAAAPPEQLAAAAADYRTCDPLVFRDDFLACDGWDIRARLGAVAAPALIFSGDADRLTPPKLAEELRAGLPRAELVALPGCGHLPMVERPDEMLAAICGWLDRGFGEAES